MKSSASESKPFQSRSKGEIPGRARRKERLSRSKLKQAFLTDSDAELFMYLIQYIRFGSWKVRRLNRALESRLRKKANVRFKLKIFLKMENERIKKGQKIPMNKTSKKLLIFGRSN